MGVNFEGNIRNDKKPIKTKGLLIFIAIEPAGDIRRQVGGKGGDSPPYCLVPC